MKKLAILVGAFLISTTTFAQKATMDNPFSLEGSMNLNTGNGLAWQSPTIRARYFVNENIAVRASLGLGDGLGTPLSESYTFSEFNSSDSTSNRTGTSEIRRMAWNAQIGAEYHLKGTDRLSPYFMLGINFGGGSETVTNTDTDGTVFVPDYYLETTEKMSMFGVGLGAGLDIYLIENLYVGLELGLNFAQYSYKDMTTTETSGGNSTSNLFDDDYKRSYLGTGAANAAVRFGWRF
ncbi:MAG: porin family protein [Crocinitomicaceae bacterium]|nr:porin family protein [Crocinitomicaceae bacterium]